MTISELLKELFNLTDEQLSELATKMKENKIYTASEENLDIRYGKLKDEHGVKMKELEEANGLIEQLKKSNKGNEELQGKITSYESQVEQLQKELQDTKIKSAIKVALLSEKALDVDYLTFKLESKLKDEGKNLELDDNDNIKGWDAYRDSLKTQFPTQFETSTSKKVEANKLPNSDEKPTFTKGDILKKSYAERMKIFEENPEAYNEVMKG